jgi:DNA invertase Pin-like site-specific DNA recombinase
VTQSFNTTTSMGRLTLNVLLSFAQFEREVTGERIRDKIAASKKKGLWVGGVVPLGYEVKDRKLIVNDEEAATVRLIFSRYLDLGSLSALQRDLRERGMVTRKRTLPPAAQSAPELSPMGHWPIRCATECISAKSTIATRAIPASTRRSSTGDYSKRFRPN